MLDEHTTSQRESDRIGNPSGTAPFGNPNLPNADQRTLEELEIGLDTSDLIIGITRVFNSEQSYDAAMNGVLEMISHVLNPERLIVFERGERTTSCIFEWCGEGVPPQMHRMQNMPNEHFDRMGKLANDEKMIEKDVDEIKAVNTQVARDIDRGGVTRMMAVPLINNGAIFGYLSANNYKLAEDLDAKRVLDTVASFIAARIINQRLVSELEHAGTHDRLTGLLNRWGIDAAIEEHMAENPDEPYVLALVDVDDFKRVNDRYGHDVGDAALKSLANTLVRIFPESAIIGRNGGDEFLVMMFGEDARMADTFLNVLAAEDPGCDLNGKHYDLSMSVGYVTYPDQARDLPDAYVKADNAMYAIKLSGKSGIAQYSPEMDPQYRSQLGFTAHDIVDNIPGAILVYGRSDDSEILFANDELIELLECDDYTDLMSYSGGSFWGIVHPDDRNLIFDGKARKACPDDVEGKKTIGYRVIAKSGTTKPVIDISRATELDKLGSVYYTLMVD